MFTYSAAVTDWFRRLDRYRLAISVAFAGVTGIEHALGYAVPWQVYALFAAHGSLAAAALVAGREGHQGGGRGSIRRRAAVLAGDAVAVAMLQYMGGGTRWYGIGPLLIVVALGVSSLPAGQVVALCALCGLAYGAILFGDTSGLLPQQPLAGAPPSMGTLTQGVEAFLYGLGCIAALGLILGSLVRLLRRAAESHRLLLDTAQDLVLTLDHAGRATFVNSAVVTQTGYATPELLGTLPATLVFPADVPALRAAFREVLRGTPRTLELRYRPADGSPTRWLSMHMAPLYESPSTAPWHGRLRGWWRRRVPQAAHASRRPEGEGTARARGAFCIARDVTEHKALEEQLTRAAFHDALTGLANRALFRERVTHALARHAARGSELALLYLDLDGFKTVNDGLGHGAGDELLVAVARRLLAATRGCDTVARLGGDEFAVLLDNPSDEGVATVAERILFAIQRPQRIGGREVRIGASIGVARPGPGDGAEELLRNADAAMYRAKARGKGCWERFTPALHAAALDRLELDADLRRAVAHAEASPAEAEFSLLYQPIVALATGQLCGAEALVRWDHPERGRIAPTLFIPAAEDAGLVVPLGRWVLRTACFQGAEWVAALADGGALAHLPGAEAARREFSLSVNVSGHQLSDPRFVRDVSAALADSGLPARHLVLEITESAVIGDPDAAVVRLTALRALGVRLAVDDFGTGYSSLGHLQRFPVDVLKIDKSFVDGITEEGRRAALARTVVGLGDALALRTVAEGVETEAQRRMLVGMGCTLGQGWLFARPLPAPELLPWLARAAEAAPEAASGDANGAHGAALGAATA